MGEDSEVDRAMQELAAHPSSMNFRRFHDAEVFFRNMKSRCCYATLPSSG
jgi:hypothetical protein